ncbi:MAG: hypothetical protein BM564_04340 [Bacteroidetes bacterium MedPE-SWsnd-G2]|nr:MAG: hypothetical protein BM564_04340 [Bacteroidetes bacterium MedPE-SWsnd-G2]
MAESYFLIEPELEDVLEEKEPLFDRNASLSETNKAFNEDHEFEDLMKNFRTVKDEVKTTSPETTEESESQAEDYEGKYTARKASDYAVSKKEKKDFDAINDVLNKHKNKPHSETKNSNSSFTYSLKDRTLLNYDTPIYLCETSGKIIINISVNEKGEVIETYVNNASTTKNQCLIDHALSYAKNVLFDASSTTKSQIGSITFYFKGKT